MPQKIIRRLSVAQARPGLAMLACSTALIALATQAQAQVFVSPDLNQELVATPKTGSSVTPSGGTQPYYAHSSGSTGPRSWGM